MYRKLFLIYLFTVFAPGFHCLGQSKEMIASGQIVFERRENTYAILDREFIFNGNKDFEDYAKSYKAAHGQFKSSEFMLSFNANESLYKSSVKNNERDFLTPYASSNVVYTSFANHFVKTEKIFFEKSYAIRDTLRRVKWRLTGETREIAGYLCRRANGLTADSLYIVAFYTDQISPRGGPESFSGLPGMILGIAIPDEHVTWFATTVRSITEMPKVDFTPKFSGIPVNRNQFNFILQENSSIKEQTKRNNYIRKRFLF
jgi:GLPGLI family protein